MYHSNTYSDFRGKIHRILTCSCIIIFLIFPIDELSSNHLPVLDLKLENVNLIKKDKTLIKTDWSKYTKNYWLNTNKWKNTISAR